MTEQERISPKTAAACSLCDGCQWQGQREGANWCYMFEQAPENLPCAQHDKFAIEQAVTRSLVRRRPEVLAMIIGSISNP